MKTNNIKEVKREEAYIIHKYYGEKFPYIDWEAQEIEPGDELEALVRYYRDSLQEEIDWYMTLCIDGDPAYEDVPQEAAVIIEDEDGNVLYEEWVEADGKSSKEIIAAYLSGLGYGPDTIECDGSVYTGYMFGDDECYDGTLGFYQYLAAEDGSSVYMAYYNTTDEDGRYIPVEDVDYDHAWMITDVTDYRDGYGWISKFKAYSWTNWSW